MMQAGTMAAHPRLKMRVDLGELRATLKELVDGADGFPFTEKEREVLEEYAERARWRIQTVADHLWAGDLPFGRLLHLMRNAISAVNDVDLYLTQVWEDDQADRIADTLPAQVLIEDPEEAEGRRLQ